ncbi:Replication initiator protein A [Deinococcus detaillensis]|uniref:Replication initiator protein A n=1 Tax=Deinococcus detaillensis TaxID=2592048 RepID=A0A553UPL8_9DEIO|nr:replication initiator protein A [Deinococcus detaillensis]TSA82158.1 Replication initiator protein A [Deinococcus detaillensis]
MTADSQNFADELNIARLNLISALDIIDGLRDWSVTTSLGDRLVNVKCQALPEYGVPRGIDNDVNTAILVLFGEQGQPADGKVSVSATQLLKLAGFRRTGPYYAMLHESLERLRTTSYRISGGWRDHPKRRWSNVGFSILNKVEYSSAEGGQFDERTVITLVLAEEIVHSILSGYTKPLDLAFMHSLSRPRTRILYRVLDAMRVNPERPSEMVDVLDVNIVEWADQCKMSSSRLQDMRRGLAGPHEELIRKGYLRDVRYLGRGRSQRIVYTFTQQFVPLSPRLMARFRKYGVADGVVQVLAQDRSNVALEAAIDEFECQLAAGMQIKKTHAAALVHLIKNPDQYTVREVMGAPVKSPRRTAIPVATPVPDTGALLQSMTLQERGEYLIKQLNLLYRNKLRPQELDDVRQAVIEGRLQAQRVLEEAIKALGQIDGESFIAELKQALQT